MNMILRVVELTDDGMDGPCDLVALAAEDGAPEEEELDRKHFDTGHEASRYLCELIKQPTEKEKK